MVKSSLTLPSSSAAFDRRCSHLNVIKTESRSGPSCARLSALVHTHLSRMSTEMFGWMEAANRRLLCPASLPHQCRYLSWFNKGWKRRHKSTPLHNSSLTNAFDCLLLHLTGVCSGPRLQPFGFSASLAEHLSVSPAGVQYVNI